MWFNSTKVEQGRMKQERAGATEADDVTAACESGNWQVEPRCVSLDRSELTEEMCHSWRYSPNQTEMGRKILAINIFPCISLLTIQPKGKGILLKGSFLQYKAEKRKFENRSENKVTYKE